jgi:hypothetical protein
MTVREPIESLSKIKDQETKIIIIKRCRYENNKNHRWNKIYYLLQLL